MSPKAPTPVPENADTNELIAENRRLSAEVDTLRRELQLMKLRRQITPHFLFNSLSVAIGLVMQSPRTGIRFLRHVAQMYRYLLQFGDACSVPVEQEMEMMHRYGELMSMRHVGCIRLQVSPEAKLLRGYPLPPLALQGLLENAIKHNRHTEDEPLTISIDSDGRFLSVSNPVRPLRSDAVSTHTGLAYMDQTMQLLFHRNIDVVNDGHTFTVRLPLISAGEK